MTFRGAANALLAALIAPPCACCGHVNDDPLAGAVCRGCWDALAATAVLHSTTGPRPLAHVAAVGLYDGRLREVIHALKYDGRRSVAPPLARLMAALARDTLAGADLVVPVPLHRVRQRARGFNQAEDLARGLGRPVALLLGRIRATQSQVELPAAARAANVRNAFALRRPVDWRVCGATIVLVDDVATTGATLEACARPLVAAGAREVRGLTAARVVT